VARNPKFEGKLCYGADLSTFNPEEGWTRLQLRFLLEAYEFFPRKDEFFTSYIDKLAGTDQLRKQIEAGWDEARIRASWEQGLEQYKLIRKKYLIYDDNE